MANFDKNNLAGYVFTLYLEAICVTSLNMICAYIAGSIPYANAAFTIHYFFFLFWTSTYVPDSFIFPRSPSVKYFWSWLSYDRLWFYPVMRDEYINHPVNCTPNELVPLDVNTALYYGLGDAGVNMSVTAVAGNTALYNSLTGITHLQFATAAQNASLAQLTTLASNVNNAATALAAATTLSAAAQAYIATQLTTAIGAYATFAGISPNNTAAVTQSVGLALEGASNIGFSELLVAVPVAAIPSCLITDGVSALQAIVGMVIYTTYPNGSVSGNDVDHWDVTPNGLLYGLQVIYGLFYFFFAWAALRNCNFRQK